MNDEIIWKLFSRRENLPESTKVSTEGCLNVFNLFTATLADENFSGSEQANTDTANPVAFFVPEWGEKTPAPTGPSKSMGNPNSHEKLPAEPLDHHEENMSIGIET